MKTRAFLADSVQSLEGKVYALGAGWNRLLAPGFPARHDRVGLAVLITVERGEDGEHNVEIALEGPAGQPLSLFTDPSGGEQYAINATFQAKPQGDGLADVVIPLSVNVDGLTFPSAGTYAFTVRIDGKESERMAFRVDKNEGQSAMGPGHSTGSNRAEDAGYL